MKSPRVPRQPLVGVALAAIAGIVLADWISLPLEFVGGALLFAVALSFWRPGTLLIFFAIGALFFALHQLVQIDAPGKKLTRLLGDRSRPIVVTGEVTSEAKIGNGGFATFLLRLDWIELGGRRENSSATIRARWKVEPQLGDEIRLTGLVEPIEPARNAGVFDERAYFARRDIYHSVFARYPEDGAVVRPNRGNFILRMAAKSRAWLETVLTRDLEDSPDVAALIKGMALGVRHETEEDIEEPFQQTGTLHLFAVAGLHVGIIAQLLWILARLIRLPRVAAAATIIPFLFFYSAITGLHVSSVRAATMAAVLLGGIFFERRVLALNSLAAAAILILAVDPNQLFSSGFQLSFAVVGAIIVGQEKIFRPLLRLCETDPFLPRSLVTKSRRAVERGYSWIARGVSVSAAAWMGSFLFIIWYFYLITPISVLANLAVVPIAFFILAVALLSILIAPISAGFSLIFNNANWSLCKLVLGLVEIFSHLSGGHIYVERPHWPNAARTEITVLDAGAGAAVHLRTRGRDWLFDTGSTRDYENFLRDYLHSRGINRLDGLLLSHGDSRHLGGAFFLLDEFNPRRVVDNAAADRSRIHHLLIARLPQRELIARSNSIQFSPDVIARIIYPPNGIRVKAADDSALVMRLDISGGPRLLFTSDSGLLTEEALLKQPNELRSEVLIKGQHFSGESGSAAFLNAVQPQLIIATSEDFPARERIPDDWARSVRDRGITLFRQDETGAVTLQFFKDRWEAVPLLHPQETFRSSRR